MPIGPCFFYNSLDFNSRLSVSFYSISTLKASALLLNKKTLAARLKIWPKHRNLRILNSSAVILERIIIIIIILQIWEHMESETMVLYLSCDRIYLAIWRPIYTSTLGLFEWYFFALSPSNYPIASFDQEILSVEYRM